MIRSISLRRAAVEGAEGERVGEPGGKVEIAEAGELGRDLARAGDRRCARRVQHARR